VDAGRRGYRPLFGQGDNALAVWLGTWVVLHYALRERELKLSTWLVVFLVGVGSRRR